MLLSVCKIAKGNYKLVSLAILAILVLNIIIQWWTEENSKGK